MQRQVMETLVDQLAGRPSGAQRRAIERITAALRPDEVPLALVLGNAEDAAGKETTVGALLLTNMRITYQGSLMGRNKAIDLRLVDVDSIVSDHGILVGRVTMSVPGNVLSVAKIDKKSAAAFATLARDEVDAAKDRQTQRGAPGPIADELAKLAELRSAGVLTAAEFDAAKAQFLGG